MTDKKTDKEKAAITGVIVINLREDGSFDITPAQEMPLWTLLRIFIISANKIVATLSDSSVEQDTKEQDTKEQEQSKDISTPAKEGDGDAGKCD